MGRCVLSVIWNHIIRCQAPIDNVHITYVATTRCLKKCPQKKVREGQVALDTSAYEDGTSSSAQRVVYGCNPLGYNTMVLKLRASDYMLLEMRRRSYFVSVFDNGYWKIPATEI